MHGPHNYVNYCLQVILGIDFSNLDDLRTFCTGECVGKFVDYYAICPDDGNAENVNTLDSSEYNIISDKPCINTGSARLP